MCEGRAECESQQRNERDGGQSPVGNRGALTLFEGGLGVAFTFGSFNFGRRALSLFGGGLREASNFNSVSLGLRVRTLLGGVLGAVSTLDLLQLWPACAHPPGRRFGGGAGRRGGSHV